MKFPSIKSLSEGILTTVKRFPFETLFALCAAIAGTAWARNHDWGSQYQNNCMRLVMMSNIGLLLSLATSLYTESRDIAGFKKLLLKVAAALISVAFFWLLNPFIRSNDTLRFFLLSFGFHLLVAFAAFTQKGRVQGFWQFNKTLFLRFLAGVLYSGVLYVGLLAAIVATKYLFNVHWSDDTYLILWIWIVCIFNSIFFLAGVPADFNALDEDLSYPKGLKIFTQYVLIPLATIYVIILLAYEFKILIEWRLPKGYVSNLIIAYAEFGILSILLVYPIREMAENKWLKIYARYFYVLLIPLIVLLFLAILARVRPYGVTPERYFLIVLDIWLAFITAYFLLSKKQSIKMIPASLCVLTLLSAYGPQSAFPVSNWSQTHIVVGIFKKYNAFHDGKLQPVNPDKISEKDATNALAKLSYLTNNDAWESLQSYMSENLVAVNDSLNKKLKSGNGKNLYGYRFSRYGLQEKKLDWLKKHLGLKKFTEYGSYGYDDADETERELYHFSVESDQALSVKNNDYVIILNNMYGNRQDTSIDHANHISFVHWNDNGLYSLLVNGEKASFDLKALAGKLASPVSLKKYKENTVEYSTGKEYTLADSLMTFTAQTSGYVITLKVNDMRFNMDQKDVLSISELSGYYLIKVKK
ncbi:MAG TPA: DUF4153 domain-containing protein [Mucilaginibacter sp.]|jgi:hypothetical protein|nr:DUF4153 domain-containing protein [Mucilaginibacter sp.]